MKSNIIIIFFSVILLSLTSCGGRSESSSHSHAEGVEHNPNTHTHADGTVHSDHAPEQDLPEQESFHVEADSILKADTVKHDHSHDSHDHAH